MKQVLFSCCCFFAATGFSQQNDQPLSYQLELNTDGAESAKTRPTGKHKDRAVSSTDSIQLPNQPFALIGTGRVRTLAQYNMPCIVPDMPAQPAIANALRQPRTFLPRNNKKTYRPPSPNAIPNPAPPIRFRRYNP